MADHESSPSDCGGRGAILSFQLTGPDGATVVVTVDHRDPDGVWSPTGSLAMIAPSESALTVPVLKAERRLRVAGDAADLRASPPRWLPC